MTPQAKTILKHLQSYPHITPLEALGVYGVFRLAARIKEIRDHIDESSAILSVHTENVADANGKRYARYSLRMMLDGDPANDKPVTEIRPLRSPILYNHPLVVRAAA